LYNSFICSSDVPVEVTDADKEHFAKDGDFSMETKEEIKTLVLNSINEVTSYDACSNEGNDISFQVRLCMIKIMSF
jgi:hypothetical protein